MKIAPLLEGIRALSGEKIQWYLAAELRDRIRQSGVRISVIDKFARKQYAVEPRQYEGRLLHQLPAVRTPRGDAYVELYLNEPSDSNRVALFRHGTRVIEDLALLDDFARPPWTTRYLQGHIDAPFVNLTPGTRSGLVHDAAYAALREALQPLEHKLIDIIEDQRRAEDEQASRELLRTIQRAFREALLALPAEEYDWFDIQARAQRAGSGAPGANGAAAAGGAIDEAMPGAPEPELGEERQRQFFEFAGPCSAWRYRRLQASCASANHASCGRCRATARGAGSNRISSSCGGSPRAPARSKIRAIKRCVSSRQPSRASRACASPRGKGTSSARPRRWSR